MQLSGGPSSRLRAQGGRLAPASSSIAHARPTAAAVICQSPGRQAMQSTRLRSGAAQLTTSSYHSAMAAGRLHACRRHIAPSSALSPAAVQHAASAAAKGASGAMQTATGAATHALKAAGKGVGRAASAAAVAATRWAAAIACAITATLQAALLTVTRNTAAATYLAAGSVVCGAAVAAAGGTAAVRPAPRPGRHSGDIVACQSLWTWQLVWLLTSSFLPTGITIGQRALLVTACAAVCGPAVFSLLTASLPGLTLLAARPLHWLHTRSQQKIKPTAKTAAAAKHNSSGCGSAVAATGWATSKPAGRGLPSSSAAGSRRLHSQLIALTAAGHAMLSVLPAAEGRSYPSSVGFGSGTSDFAAAAGGVALLTRPNVASPAAVSGEQAWSISAAAQQEVFRRLRRIHTMDAETAVAIAALQVEVTALREKYAAAGVLV